MPAAAVIPAPIAYIKVVAVKKFVVEFLDATAVRLRVCTCCSRPNLAEKACGLNCCAFGSASITVSKLECLKRAFRLNTLAWNNEIGLWCYFVGCVPK